MQNLFFNPKKAALMVAPALIVLLFAMLAPILISIFYSLTDWAGFGKYQWVGLQNYRSILFSDPIFWRSLLNVLLFTIAILGVQHPFAYFLAAILTRLSAKASQIFRTLFFIPAILTVVVTTKLWVFIYNPNFGMLNKFFTVLGFNNLADIAWLSDPSTALISVIVIMVWQGFGWALLFYYAALMTVPSDIKDAAQIDGANGFQYQIRIVIPYIAPVINMIVILAIISCLKTMEAVFLSTEGGPSAITQFPAVYLYRKAFVYQEYGYGNAISVLFVIITLTVTVITNRAVKNQPGDLG